MMERCAVCSLRCSYTQYGKLSSIISEEAGGLDNTVYEADVVLKFHIKSDKLPSLSKKLADVTAGSVQIETEKEEYFASFEQE